MKQGLKIITATLFLLVTTTSIGLAQSRPSIVPTAPEGQEEPIILPTPPKGDNALSAEVYFGGVLLPSITRTVIALAGGLALLFVIIGAVQILTAYGNEEAINAGRKTLTYALVGMLVAMLSYAIVSIIGSIQLGQPQLAPGTEDTQPNEEPGPYQP